MAAQVLLIGALSKSTEGINKLNNTIADGVSLFDEAQKTSLALGKNLAQTRDTLAPSLDGLRGSIDDKLSVGLAQLNSGLQGNVREVNNLALQQRLTGQDTQKTYKVFSELVAIGGVQTYAANQLADQLRENSAQYGVSTEMLVGTLDGLSENLASQNLLGFGTEIQGAVAQLQATLGPEFQGQLTSIVNTILKPGTDSLAQLSQLGIVDARARIEAAKGDQAAILGILTEVIPKAGEAFTSIAGGANATLTSIGIASDAIGKTAPDFAIVGKAIAEGGRAIQEGEKDFTKTISTLWSEAFNPLKEAILPIIQDSLPAVGVVANILGASLGIFADAVSSLYKYIRQSVLTDYLDDLEYTVWDTANTFKETSLIMRISVAEFQVSLLKAIDSIPGLSAFSGPTPPFKLMEFGISVMQTELEKIHNETRENKEVNKETAENTKPVQNKYILETDNIITGAITKVLGLKEDKSLKLQEQVVDALREVNDRLAENKPSPVPQFGGSL